MERENPRNIPTEELVLRMIICRFRGIRYPYSTELLRRAAHGSVVGVFSAGNMVANAGAAVGREAIKSFK